MDDKEEDIFGEEEDALADTQPQTYSQTPTIIEKPEVESQALVEKEPWSRLFKRHTLRRTLGPARGVLRENDQRDFIDVRGSQFRFGRDPQCEYVAKKNDETYRFSDKSWNRISKIHFKLTKDIYSDLAPVIITDLSRNGTFLNGELIGLNQERFLKTGDVISTKDVKIFEFKDLSSRRIVDLPNDIQNRYFVESNIGSGAFGEVYKVLDRKLNPFAVKYIKGHSASVNQVTDNEIKILLTLEHVCIIRTIDIVKDNFGGASLILEYMEGGDLLTRIMNTSIKRLSEDQARCVMYQVTDAISYLHGKGITHRDIKLDNILCKDNSAMTLVKVTDFGLAKLVTEGMSMRSMVGTPKYVAPEILNEQVTTYSSKVDIWSMGVMLFIMLCGTLPFSEDNGDVREQILSGQYEFNAESWKDISRDAVRLIRRMLVVNPKIRINTDDILETNWMDAKFDGIKKAKLLMERNGGNVARIINKENEFTQLQPPKKRARLY